MLETTISEIKRKINDLRDDGILYYIPREEELLKADRVVSVITGIRRCGKSFRTIQEIDTLIQSGWLESIDHVCRIDFDNPHFSKLTATDLGIIRDTFLSMTPGAGRSTHLLFIFNEIHRIEGWEDFVVDLSRNANWQVCVTGSSSKLLGTDIATSLRGKSLSTRMFPLSFREFLRFRDIPVIETTEGRARAMAAFEEYLHIGGFPQVVLSSPRVREALLREYFDTMLLKDIIQRHNVSRPVVCTALYRYLLSLIGKPFTRNSAFDYLRQSGYPATNTLISDYIREAEDAYLLYTVPIFSDSRREIDRNYRKCYCVDWGLAVRNSQSWDGAYSRPFENMVYLHLKRLYPRVNYYLTRSHRQEVDFIACDVSGKPVSAVQACLQLSDATVMKREIDALATTSNYFGIKNAVIVTSVEQRRIEHGALKIRIVPAWCWLTEG